MDVTLIVIFSCLISIVFLGLILGLMIWLFLSRKQIVGNDVEDWGENGDV